MKRFNNKMSEAEIQKVILNDSTPETIKERRESLLKIKRKRKRARSKFSRTKGNKLLKKKFETRIKKEKSTIDDEISLETHSTVISLDEESNMNSYEYVQYSEQIELVLKNIYSKGIMLQNLKQFITIENGNGKSQEKSQSVKFSTEKLKKCLESFKFSEKINLILDIDETLVFSKMIKELQNEEEVNVMMEKLIKEKKEDIFYIKIESNNRVFIFEMQIRKTLAHFFKQLNPYCNFYINSMASPIYIKEVINILFTHYGLRFSSINETNIFYTSSKDKKFISEEIRKKDFLILDDNICAWDTGYIPSIVPVRKFRSNENEMKNVFYQYYLFSNKIYCFDEMKRPFINAANNVPYSVELPDNEKSQLYYICELIKKSFILSKILEIPIRHALHFFQNTILKECYIYYNGTDKDFISDLIIFLGGTIVNDPKDATHIIYDQSGRGGAIDAPHDNKYILESKWLFDCFFYSKRCDEFNSEYKLR